MDDKMDFSKPFNYFTEDNNWATKYILGAVLGLVPIVNFLVSGYLLKLIDSNPGQKNLPEWDDWGDLFKNGFFLFVTQMIYALPAIIIGVISLVFLIPIIVLIAQEKNTAITFSMLIIPIIGGFIVVVYMLIISALTPAITLIFNRTKSISAALNIGKVLEITRNNFKNIVLIILVFWGVGLVMGTLGNIPFLGFLVIIAARFYVTLIAGHLYGQLDKKAYEPSEVIQE